MGQDTGGRVFCACGVRYKLDVIHEEGEML